VVEKLRHLGQHRFDLLVAGTCSSERHNIAQQNSLPILWFSSCSSNCSCGGGSWEGSAVIMCIQKFSVAGDLACRPNCNWRKSVWKSIRRDRNPARQTKSHQAMWCARASTGLPPCHDLVAGGGEFLCPRRAMGEQRCAQNFSQ
jgi:hypothetical protein